MDTRVFSFLIILTVVQLRSVEVRNVRSDNCDILRAMGFKVFQCTTSAYPDRAECVPRGHQDGNRLRWRRPGDFDPMNAVCDSRIDCGDGSDEMLAACAPLHEEYCIDGLEMKEIDGEFLNAFRCYNQSKTVLASPPPSKSMSMCVSECQMCDGARDCPNGADEVAENCRRMRPKPDACRFF